MFNVSRIDVKEWSRMSLSQKRTIRENIRTFYIRVIAVAIVNLTLILGFFFSLIMSTVMDRSGYQGPCVVFGFLGCVVIFATALLAHDKEIISNYIQKPPHPDDIKEFARLSKQSGELTQV